MPTQQPKGIALGPESFDRVARVVRTVEQAPEALLRTRPDRPAANQWKLVFPSTDVQPGSFTEATGTVYRATATTTEPSAHGTSVALYDWFQWGADKRGPALAFRPVPSKQTYLYQPPAARWGRVSATGTSSCQINPTTVAGGAADTETTFTIALPTRDGKTVALTTGDVIAYVPTLHGQLVAVSDYSEGGGVAYWGTVTSDGVTTGADSTSPDTVNINPTTNAVGDNTDTGTTYTIILPPRDGVDHKLTGSDVIAWMNSADGNRVIVSDYSDIGSGGGGSGTVSRAGQYTMYENHVFSTTPSTNNPLDLGTFSGSTSLDGLGLETTGTYTLKCTTPTKLIVNWSAAVMVTNFLNATPSTRMTVFTRLIKNSTVQNHTLQQADYHTTGLRWTVNQSMTLYMDLTSGDTFYVEGACREIPQGSTASLRSGVFTFLKVQEPESTRSQMAVSFEIDEDPGLTGNSTSQNLSFINQVDNLGATSDIALERSLAGNALACFKTGGATVDISYTLTPRCHFESTNATSDTLTWDVRTQWIKNSNDVPETRRRYTYTIPSTRFGYDLYGGTLSARHLMELSSGDTLTLEFEVYPNCPNATSWTIVEGQVTYTRLDKLQ